MALFRVGFQGARFMIAIGILLLTIHVTVSQADVPPRSEPVAALFGEWQIVEMIHKGKVQDLSKARGGCWIKLEERHFAISYAGREYVSRYPCTMGDGIMDVDLEGKLSKALYEYKDDKLRIIWRDDFGDRPKTFDAVGKPEVTLLVLKRADG